MKILVLMPLDEKSVYMAIGIYKALPHEIQEKTFCMPVFMDYLVQTRLVQNWGYALFDTLLSAKKIYEATGKNDLIIIGNTDKKYEFDVVFNFQDLEQDMPYKDEFVDKARELVQSEEILVKMLSNLYTNEDSKMPLHNCVATADFLTRYLGTDPHLDRLAEEYQKELKKLNGHHTGE